MVYSPGTMFNIPESVRMSTGKKRNLSYSLKTIRSTLDRIVAMDKEIREARKHAAKLQAQYRRMVQHTIPKMEHVRAQLARRAAYPWGGKGFNLLTRKHLTENESERLRHVVRITKNMSAGIRTVKRLPLPRNIREKIGRMTAFM
jgi:hypothetical protein